MVDKQQNEKIEKSEWKHIRIAKEVQKRLRKYAFDQEVEMQEIASEAVSEYLQKRDY
ncbi:hypothetical protein ACNM7U_08795 [Aerococcus viridans]|jgi:hypothetical protein